MTCLFCRDADGVERSFGGPSIGAKTRDRIDHDEMIVSAADDEHHAFREKRRRESALALRNVVRVLDNAGSITVARGRTAEKWELPVRAESGPSAWHGNASCPPVYCRSANPRSPPI